MTTLATFKGHLRAALGYAEDSSGNVADYVRRMFQRTHFYHCQARQAANRPTFANTHSLSASQPILVQTIFAAEESCVVQAVGYVIPRHWGYTTAVPSVTCTASETWTLEIRRYASPTWSVTQTVIATLTSATDSITVNKPGAVIACTINGTTTLAAGDTLTMNVTKQLGGVQFAGGLIKITVDEA